MSLDINWIGCTPEGQKILNQMTHDERFTLGLTFAVTSMGQIADAHDARTIAQRAMELRLVTGVEVPSYDPSFYKKLIGLRVNVVTLNNRRWASRIGRQLRDNAVKALDNLENFEKSFKHWEHSNEELRKAIRALGTPPQTAEGEVNR
jgi:hypothetical protein